MIIFKSTSIDQNRTEQSKWHFLYFLGVLDPESTDPRIKESIPEDESTTGPEREEKSGNGGNVVDESKAKKKGVQKSGVDKKVVAKPAVYQASFESVFTI